MLTVDVFADIACPWCWIGEARLERALARRGGQAIDWRWRPYQLQPGLPSAGEPWAAFVERKFGGAANARQMFAHVAGIGAREGLDYRFDRIANAPHTADAHRMVLFAMASGRGRETADALFRGYFSEGRDICHAAALIGIGASAGLDADALTLHLAGGAGRAEVLASQREAARMGVRGVPFYVFNGRLAVSGAQPAELFERAIAEATDGGAAAG
jgi:predicted DsbA family dithiol-disulfide isomerase